MVERKSPLSRRYKGETSQRIEPSGNTSGQDKRRKKKRQKKRAATKERRKALNPTRMQPSYAATASEGSPYMFKDGVVKKILGGLGKAWRYMNKPRGRGSDKGGLISLKKGDKTAAQQIHELLKDIQKDRFDKEGQEFKPGIHSVVRPRRRTTWIQTMEDIAKAKEKPTNPNMNEFRSEGWGVGPDHDFGSAHHKKTRDRWSDRYSRGPHPGANRSVDTYKQYLDRKERAPHPGDQRSKLSSFYEFAKKKTKQMKIGGLPTAEGQRKKHGAPKKRPKEPREPEEQAGEGLARGGKNPTMTANRLGTGGGNVIERVTRQYGKDIPKEVWDEMIKASGLKREEDIEPKAPPGHEDKEMSLGDFMEFIAPIVAGTAARSVLGKAMPLMGGRASGALKPLGKATTAASSGFKATAPLTKARQGVAAIQSRINANKGGPSINRVMDKKPSGNTGGGMNRALNRASSEKKVISGARDKTPQNVLGRSASTADVTLPEKKTSDTGTRKAERSNTARKNREKVLKQIPRWNQDRDITTLPHMR